MTRMFGCCNIRLLECIELIPSTAATSLYSKMLILTPSSWKHYMRFVCVYPELLPGLNIITAFLLRSDVSLHGSRSKPLLRYNSGLSHQSVINISSFAFKKNDLTVCFKLENKWFRQRSNFPKVMLLSSDWDWAWAWAWASDWGLGIGMGNLEWEMGMGKWEWK